MWHQGIFGAGAYTMEELAQTARLVDFAVLVMTPDDVLETRGATRPAPRGNVLLELGLFMGALGVNRVLILTPKSPELELPSDLHGVTRLTPYDSSRGEPDLRGALGPAAYEAKLTFARRGPREPTTTSTRRGDEHTRLLARELDLFWSAIDAQGWRRIRPHAATALRVESPRGKRFTMRTFDEPARTRAELRDFAKRLRADGLRVSARVREPIEA